ncbi:zinc-finger homeodomain protein 10-like [Chenopodium quinoa]|uniref:zinc-finger homeodomain protein 10-like n=1 Tax=Chenopodium quinoa TaxID=63459 RepID=UPI000B7743B8|nr:zinc-finger homeodomain protein 10-like [Chenopodium quinoa]
MDMTTARATIAAATTAAAVVGGAGVGGLSIVPPSKSPEAESETPPRIQSSKPLSFSNGVLKRHAPAIVLYKECLKNHAASLGGHALDGCGEFMPAPTATASDPTSLKCAACGCHRNFHRREPEETVNATTPLTHVIEYHPHHRHHPLPPPASNPQTAPAVATRGVRSPGSQSPPPISSSYYPGSAPHMLLALSSGGVGATTGVVLDNNTPTTNNGPHHPHHHHHPHQQHHHHHNHNHNHNQAQHLMNSSSSQPPSRKRFRTKFSQDQKDRMHEFAEKVGWKMQKTNEDLVNGFCNEIGVERGVFKVWMHNNKNTFAKRSTTATTTSGVAATNPTDDLINNPNDDDEINGNLTGNGNSNSSISINDQSHHHHNHQYNGGKSNESNAPTNGSSSSS